MLTKNPLTIGTLKKWCAENCVLDDIPIGIYIGDSERGDIAYGVIGETKNKPKVVGKKRVVVKLNMNVQHSMVFQLLQTAQKNVYGSFIGIVEDRGV